MNRRRIKVSFGGCLLVLGVTFLVVGAAVLAWTIIPPTVDPAATPGVTSSPVVPSAAPTPTPTPQPTPTVDPAPDPKPGLVAVAKRYVTAYQAGRTSGGETWLTQLRPVTSPALLKAVAETDPYLIPTATAKTPVIEQVAADGTGLVRVDFQGGDWLLLHTAPNPAGGVWVIAVEGSKATPTP